MTQVFLQSLCFHCQFIDITLEAKATISQREGALMAQRLKKEVNFKIKHPGNIEI